MHLHCPTINIVIMSLMSYLDAIFVKVAMAIDDLTEDIRQYTPQQPLPHSSPLESPFKYNRSHSPKRAISKTKIKPLVGFSPQRQKSLVLQIKIAERKKRHLLDELKVVDKSLSLLLSEQSRYEALSTSNSKVHLTTSDAQRSEKALELVRRMSKRRKEMEIRKQKTEQQLHKEAQKSFDKIGGEARKKEQIRKLEKQKELNLRMQNRRFSCVRRNVTQMSKPSPSFFQMTEVDTPDASRIKGRNLECFPKLQTKRHPKTRMFKLIEEQTRIKKISQQLKQKSKLYNLEKKKLYNLFHPRSRSKDLSVNRSQKSHLRLN